MNGVADRVLTPEEALEHYGPLVLRTAFGLVKNLQDAEDFLKLGADRLGTSRIVKAAKAMEKGE